MAKLEQAFYSYQQKTRAAFKEAKEDAGDLDEKDLLLSAVKSLEIKEQDQYKNLLKSIEQSFSEKYKWDIEKALKTFLRRSGFYLNLFEDKIVNPENYIAALDNAFDKVDSTIDRWYIVPVEGTWLKDEITVSDDFKIISLEKDEWEHKLINRPNKYFYPKSNLDIDILSQYDCLAIKEAVAFEELIRRSFSVSPKSDYLSFDYSKFPSIVEEKIGQLILAEWKNSNLAFSSFDHELWFPIVMRIHHSLIDPPYDLPNLLNLNVGPVQDQETGRYLPKVIKRETPMELKAPDTKSLSEVLKLSSELLKIIDVHPKWNFIRNALKFFTKAYTSFGYEQLLWYLTSLDTLGEEDYKIKKKYYRTGINSHFDLIALRVQLLNNSSHKAFLNRFKKLKNLRNDLVHGNKDLGNHKLLKRSDLEWLHNVTRICLFEILCMLKSVFSLINLSNYPTRSLPARSRIHEIVHIQKEPKESLSKTHEQHLKADYPWLFENGKLNLS